LARYREEAEILKILKQIGYTPIRKAASKKLMRGWISANPGEVKTIMCLRCRKGVKPRPVSVHHSRPSLRLYYCPGCPDYLIKVDIEKTVS